MRFLFHNVNIDFNTSIKLVFSNENNFQKITQFLQTANAYYRRSHKYDVHMGWEGMGALSLWTPL